MDLDLERQFAHAASNYSQKHELIRQLTQAHFENDELKRENAQYRRALFASWLFNLLFGLFCIGLAHVIN